MIKHIHDTLFNELIEAAKLSPRLRSDKNFHNDYTAPVQRLFIGLIKGTYVPPHLHPQANKWEIIMAVKGRTGLVIFDDKGKITHKLILEPGQSNMGLENPPNSWHTVYPIDDQSVIMEIKEGPFDPEQVTHFADWAPTANQDDPTNFLQWIESAKIGDSF